MTVPALSGYAVSSPASVAEPRPPSDSARGPIIAGVVVLLAFFGGLGGWAVTAPLNGAVVGNAVVKVEGNRKSVQHLDGGIVKELRVREGDTVKQGDTLIVLDDSQLQDQYDILAQQGAMLSATEARLVAEQNGLSTIDFPPTLMAQRGKSYVEMAISGQLKEFSSRKAALSGQESILQQRINQAQEQIAGLQSNLTAYRAQLQSVVDEKASLADLEAKQLIPRARILQLERTAAGLQGQIGQGEADIAKAGQAIGELNEQIAQLRKDLSQQVAQDLRDTRLKMLDVGPRLESAKTSLARLEIRAPYSGKVVDLSVFSVGGVIRPGEKILDIVPEDTGLVVEAQVNVEDISDIRPGMAAEVHFTSYKQRTIPLIHGRVQEISADRLTNEKTGAPYYVVQVEVDRRELAASPQIQLYPGMPATVMITTQERTALDYLVGPLVASFDHAFRQR